MSLATAAHADPADPPTGVEPLIRRPSRWRWHLFVTAIAVTLGSWLTHGLWSDPAGHVLAKNVGDQAFFEWVLGYGSYALSHGTDPFFTNLLNAPLGVNLAANTSITVYAVLFAPLTTLAGPQYSFAAILTLNLICSAIVWYLFLLRHIVRHPAAAALGGLFAGFAPGFISHANGHLNWSSGWVAPAVLWWVLKLRDRGRWLRTGAILGLLVAIGFSIAAEGLFFTALASAVFMITWSAARATRAEARAALPTVAAALGVAAVVAGVLLAYPIYMHFAGPQSFSGTGFNQRFYAEDIGSYWGYPSRSLAGLAGLGSDLAPNPTEETSFFGPPLLGLVLVAWVVLWQRATPGRRATLRALAVTGVSFILLSFGPRLRFLSDPTAIPLPYAALARLPLFDSALPARFALVVVGVFAVVLALTIDQLLDHPPRSRVERGAWTVSFAAALVPLIPVPLLYTDRSPEPQFIAAGLWKDYLPENGALTALPLASDDGADGQRWQGYTLARGGRQFRLPVGYFLGPGGHDGKGRIGPLPRRTEWLFNEAGRTGYMPPIDAFDRQQARLDFVFWGIDLVFLPQTTTGANGPLYRDAIMATATALLGPPERVADVDLWRIRPGIDPTDTVGNCPPHGCVRLNR